MPKHKPSRQTSSSDSESAPEEVSLPRAKMLQFLLQQDNLQKLPEKKSKTSTSSKKNDNEGGDDSWNLGKNKLIKLTEFKGQWYVNIREFYNSGGELKPSKKGIMLTMEQYQKLKGFIEDIDDAIKRNV